MHKCDVFQRMCHEAGQASQPHVVQPYHVPIPFAMLPKSSNSSASPTSSTMSKKRGSSTTNCTIGREVYIPSSVLLSSTGNAGEVMGGTGFGDFHDRCLYSMWMHFVEFCSQAQLQAAELSGLALDEETVNMITSGTVRPMRAGMVGENVQTAGGSVLTLSTTNVCRVHNNEELNKYLGRKRLPIFIAMSTCTTLHAQAPAQPITLNQPGHKSPCSISQVDSCPGSPIFTKTSQLDGIFQSKAPYVGHVECTRSVSVMEDSTELCTRSASVIDDCAELDAEVALCMLRISEIAKRKSQLLQLHDRHSDENVIVHSQ
jgi:hypothetical protein